MSRRRADHVSGVSVQRGDSRSAGPSVRATVTKTDTTVVSMYSTTASLRQPGAIALRDGATVYTSAFFRANVEMMCTSICSVHQRNNDLPRKAVGLFTHPSTARYYLTAIRLKSLTLSSKIFPSSWRTVITPIYALNRLDFNIVNASGTPLIVGDSFTINSVTGRSLGSKRLLCGLGDQTTHRNLRVRVTPNFLRVCLCKAKDCFVAATTFRRTLRTSPPSIPVYHHRQLSKPAGDVPLNQRSHFRRTIYFWVKCPDSNAVAQSNMCPTFPNTRDLHLDPRRKRPTVDGADR
jgi:hypothetical protein